MKMHIKHYVRKRRKPLKTAKVECRRVVPASHDHFPIFHRADVDTHETSSSVDERFAMFNVVRVQY